MNTKTMKLLLLLVTAVFTLSLTAGVQVKDENNNIINRKNTKNDKKDQKKEEKKDPNDPEMVRKIESIIIPKVDFQKIGFTEAVKQLNEMAMLNDPAKIGIAFSIDANDVLGGTETLITFTKNNVNLETVLKAVCKQSGYNYVAGVDGVKLSKPDNSRKKDKEDKL